MTVQEAKESIEYLKMQLEEDLEMICFTGDELKAIDIAIECMGEVEQYRALGTVEELKEAREKQVAKKPNITDHIEDETYMKCPSCKVTTVLFGGMIPNNCPRCGQKLDWEVGGTSD